MTPLYYSEVDYPGVGVIESYCRSEEMLTVAQVSVRLGVSRQTVYRLVEDGILAARRPGSGGGRIAVPREEVDSYSAHLMRTSRLCA